MYAGLDECRLLEIAGDPSSAEYEADIGKLVYWGLEQGLIDGCEGFVLNPSDWVNVVNAGYNSLADLALDYLEDAESKSQKEKLVWLRTFLKEELQGPREDSPSFHVWPISIGSVGFVICVVVVIEGSPVPIDYFASVDAREIEQLLRDRGYLVTDSDVENLTDEQLLALWD